MIDLCWICFSMICRTFLQMGLLMYLYHSQSPVDCCHSLSSRETNFTNPSSVLESLIRSCFMCPSSMESNFSTATMSVGTIMTSMSVGFLEVEFHWQFCQTPGQHDFWLFDVSIRNHVKQLLLGQLHATACTCFRQMNRTQS